MSKVVKSYIIFLPFAYFHSLRIFLLLARVFFSYLKKEWFFETFFQRQTKFPGVCLIFSDRFLRNLFALALYNKLGFSIYACKTPTFSKNLPTGQIWPVENLPDFTLIWFDTFFFQNKFRQQRSKTLAFFFIWSPGKKRNGESKDNEKKGWVWFG